jgi:hypothetical protein
MGMDRRARDGRTKVIPHLPMPHAVVSVAIVVRAGESHVQGEGPHRERQVGSHPRQGSDQGILDDVARALRPISPLMGPPCAVKAACTVITGGMGKHRSCCAPCPYPLILQWQRASGRPEERAALQRASGSRQRKGDDGAHCRHSCAHTGGKPWFASFHVSLDADVPTVSTL